MLRLILLFVFSTGFAETLSLSYSPAYYQTQKGSLYTQNYAQLVGVRYVHVDYQDVLIGGTFYTGKFKNKLSSTETNNSIYGADLTLGKDIYEGLLASLVLSINTFRSVGEVTAEYSGVGYGCLLEKEFSWEKGIIVIPYAGADTFIQSQMSTFRGRLGLGIGFHF